MLTSAAALAASAFLLNGCAEEPPPPPPVVEVKPPPPPPPTVTPISELMARYNIDSRIRLSEDRAPATDPERIAILSFFDAFARGDSSRVDAMLGALDRYELEKLVSNGQWESTTAKITRIDLRGGRTPVGQAAVLAVMHVDGHFEPQLWGYAVTGSDAEFEAAPTPPGIMNELSGDDWISAWFAVLAKELELAFKPDEEVVVPKTDYTPEDAGSFDTASNNSGPSAPLGPGGPGKNKLPEDQKVAPPRMPGFSN